MVTRIGAPNEVREALPVTGEPLRFLCFGMGAIGTYIGGSLAAAGNEVSFIERPTANIPKDKKPIKIDTPDGLRITDHYRIFFSLAEALKAGEYDIAMLAVKSFDTQSVVDGIRPFAERFPTILCLQNGVENEALLESVLGRGKVIGASIATAVGKKGAGDVFVEKMRGLGIESSHPFSGRLIEAFNRAGLNARGYPKRDDLKWSKMLTNLLGNATSAILDWTAAQVFSDPGVYRLEVMQVRETLAVMRKLGIHLVNLPGTPLKPLIWMIRNLPPALSQTVSLTALGKGRGNKMPSFHIDLYGGQTRSEVTYLNGAVVRAGQRLGVATPVNRVLTETLESLASGKISKEEFAQQPIKLISIIEDIK